MQDRQEGSVVVEMLNHYRRPLRAGDLLAVLAGPGHEWRDGVECIFVPLIES